MLCLLLLDVHCNIPLLEVFLSIFLPHPLNLVEALWQPLALGHVRPTKNHMRTLMP